MMLWNCRKNIINLPEDSFSRYTAFMGELFFCSVQRNTSISISLLSVRVSKKREDDSKDLQICSSLRKAGKSFI